MKFNKVITPAALFLLLGTGASVYGQHEEQGKSEKSQARPQPQQHAQQPKPKQPEQKVQPRQQQQRAAQPKPAAQAKQQQAQRAEQPKPAAQPRQQAQRVQQPKPGAQPRQQQAQRAQQSKPAAQAKQQTQRPQHAVAAKPTPFQKPAQNAQAAQKSRPAAQKTSYTPPLRTRQQAQTWQKQSSWRTDGAWQGNASWQQDRSSNWQADHRTWAQRGGYGGYYIPQASFSLNFGVGHWFRIRSQPVILDGYPEFQYGGYSFLMVDPWPADWAQDWYSADDVYVGYDNGYYLYNRQYPGEAIAITVVL